MEILFSNKTIEAFEVIKTINVTGFGGKLFDFVLPEEGPSLDRNVVVNKLCVSFTVAFNYRDLS